MSKFIIPRRRFLFLAPAVVAASSLMPGHSIGELAFRRYDSLLRIGSEWNSVCYGVNGTGRGAEVIRISHEEFFWNSVGPDYLVEPV